MRLALDFWDGGGLCGGGLAKSVDRTDAVAASLYLKGGCHE
jgi:hypothetical protein